MLTLKNVTLLGLDCINLERLKTARDICLKGIEFGAVKLLSSIESDDPSVLKIDAVDSIEKYSEFMVKHLHHYVDTQFALIFQYDGFILCADNWRDEFLQYDYIGAPWIGYYKETPDHNVGNGGFSLRSKKLLELLANDTHIKVGQPEDVLISRQYRSYLETKGIQYAPEVIAGLFAIPDVMKEEFESDLGITNEQYRDYLSKKGVVLDTKEKELVYQIPEAVIHGDLRWTNEFGFHYVTEGHIGKWLKHHPEYKGLIKVK